jgi:hypothetical protein
MSLRALLSHRRAVVTTIIILGGTAIIIGVTALASPCPVLAPIECDPPGRIIYGTPIPLSQGCTLRPQYCCGDGVCPPNERMSELCPQDCSGGPFCGNGFCTPPETAKSCPKDCAGGGPFCGDGSCTPPETAKSCEIDCGGGSSCGDGKCEKSKGETKKTCPADCKKKKKK